MKDRILLPHVHRQQCRYRWPWIGAWCVLLPLFSATMTAASVVEDEVYTTLERAVQARGHTQTVSDARAFLQQFPRSAKRSQVQFWLAEALYASRAYRDA